MCFFTITKDQEAPYSAKLVENGKSFINIREDYTLFSNSVINLVFAHGSGVNTPYSEGDNNSLNVENNYKYIYLKKHETWNNALTSYNNKISSAYEDKTWIIRIKPNAIL